MNFPWTRHFQRYEYILLNDYVKDKGVIDVGAGTCVGALCLTVCAKVVFAVDPNLIPERPIISHSWARPDRLVPVQESIYDFVGKVDVCVVIEVFEHMEDPHRFIDHVSKLCDFVFITTPLNGVTGKTRNPEHFREYSAEDFDEIVGERFEILDKVYQHADLSITDKAEPNGCSYDTGHIVQMIWARVKK